MDTIGRPEYTNDQYRVWLDEMAPFLKLGNSLYYAIERAMLSGHKTVIYEKYKRHDWFSEKIDAFQRYPGEIVNSIFVRLVHVADEKIKQGTSLTDEEWRNLRFFAEKHRSCHSFFSIRQEVTQIKPDNISEILDKLEQSNYEDLGQKAKQELALQMKQPEN